MLERWGGSAGIAAITALLTALVTLLTQRLVLKAQVKKFNAEASTSQAQAAEVSVRTMMIVIEVLRKELEEARRGSPVG